MTAPRQAAPKPGESDASVATAGESDAEVATAGGGDAGVGTVLALGATAVVLILMVGALAVLAAVHAAHRAAAAADLAALAAATVWGNAADAPSACAQAQRVASANGAVVTSCRIVGEEAHVAALATTRWPGLPDATARARAGPAPEPR